MAEDRARHGAQDEEKQHPAVAGQLAAVGFVGAVAVPQRLGQPDADLPDVVGGKGGGHRDALGLPEGIVLHRGHKVDDHLADLHRRGLGQKPQPQHRDHLNQHQHGVPPDVEPVLDRVGQQLRHERAENVGRDRDQIIPRLCPFGGPQRQAHQHDVAGLGVAEYVAAQQIGVGTLEPRDGDQCEVDPVPLTGQVMRFGRMLFFHDMRPFYSSVPFYYTRPYERRKPKMAAPAAKNGALR